MPTMSDTKTERREGDVARQSMTSNTRKDKTERREGDVARQSDLTNSYNT